MAAIAPNLFLSLFEFHPRGTHTAKENFLTEAFAYLLLTVDAVRNAWLLRLLGEDVEVAECAVTTRRSEPDPESGTTIYPDLVLQGKRCDGKPFLVWCEHKWDSGCNADQLKKYHRLVGAKGARWRSWGRR